MGPVRVVGFVWTRCTQGHWGHSLSRLPYVFSERHATDVRTVAGANQSEQTHRHLGCNPAPRGQTGHPHSWIHRKHGWYLLYKLLRVSCNCLHFMTIGGMFRFWMYRVSDDMSYERRAFFACMMGFITACLRGEPCVVCYYREDSGCQKAMISEGYRVIGKSGSPLSLTRKRRRAWYSSRSCIKSCLL